MNGAVEVEAKIGLLKDKASGRRLKLPVQVETGECLHLTAGFLLILCAVIVSDLLDYRFESNMSAVRRIFLSLLAIKHSGLCPYLRQKKQHMHFNTLLNKLKTDSTLPGHKSTPLSYNHLHLTDTFYPSENPGDREKIRVTRDQKTGQVLECMKKVRLGNMDIYSPQRAADWRISVNIEIPGTPPVRFCYSSAQYAQRRVPVLFSITSTGLCYAHAKEGSLELLT